MAEYSNQKKPVLVVAGPTAAGKTRLAIAIAKRLGGEIISADSMQIYKEMNISTAKPSPEERQGVPHHLMDFLSVSQEFSVAEYLAAARELIADMHVRGVLPIVTGGTGLYISSLAAGIRFAEARRDEALRERLAHEAKEHGNEHLWRRLESVDPTAAVRLHPNNMGRIIRALELYELTGIPMSEHVRRSREIPPEFESKGVLLYFKDRQTLYGRIERRVDEMLKAGIANEALRIMQANPCKTAAQAIGYKEFIPYFEGKITLEQAAIELKTQTRRYAKRQMTWFSHADYLTPLAIDNLSEKEIEKTALGILGNNA